MFEKSSACAIRSKQKTFRLWTYTTWRWNSNTIFNRKQELREMLANRVPLSLLSFRGMIQANAGNIKFPREWPTEFRLKCFAKHPDGMLRVLEIYSKKCAPLVVRTIPLCHVELFFFETTNTNSNAEQRQENGNEREARVQSSNRLPLSIASVKRKLDSKGILLPINRKKYRSDERIDPTRVPLRDHRDFRRNYEQRCQRWNGSKGKCKWNLESIELCSLQLLSLRKLIDRLVSCKNYTRFACQFYYSIRMRFTSL